MFLSFYSPLPEVYSLIYLHCVYMFMLYKKYSGKNYMVDEPLQEYFVYGFLDKNYSLFLFLFLYTDCFTYGVFRGV